MTQHTDRNGMPVGRPLPGWMPPPPPPRGVLEGRLVRLEPLDGARHAADLFAANRLDRDGRNFTYLATEPFADLTTYRAWIDGVAAGKDPHFLAIIDKSTGKAVGIASFMRIDPANGVIEVGHINYSPLLQGKPGATEAMYLMMRHVFDLGYRRYEWKCDSFNEPSRRAAARLGFQYEGRFRQAVVTKARNRDTDWFSILDGEWPALKRAFETWLDPANFDGEGRQRQSLSALTKAARATLKA